MADSKITALAAISTVDPTADPLVIVDVSDTSMAASGTTKKITSNQILGAGGTATLASATISGDLTVDTSTLKVDSTNNRVGIGTASPSYILDILGASPRLHIRDNGTGSSLLDIENGAGTFYVGRENSTGSGGLSGVPYAGILYLQGAYPIICGTNFTERYRIASDGVATWSNVGGVAGTAMTLNSTGLGVGGAPNSARLTVARSNAVTASRGTIYTYSTDSMAANLGGQISFGGSYTGTNETIFGAVSARKENGTDSEIGGYLQFSVTNNSLGVVERMRIDSSGTFRVKGAGTAGSTDAVQFNGSAPASALILDASGNLGVGSTPVEKVTINGSASLSNGSYLGWGNADALISGSSSSNFIFLRTNATERMRVKSAGQVRFVPLAADPAGAEAGDVYYNSSSNKLKCYNGTTWNDLF